MFSARGSVKLATNWVLTGAARWDLVANQINQYVVGAGYVDDCFVLAANYVTSFSYATTTSPPILGHAFMLQIGLRTLANTTLAIDAGGGILPTDELPARRGSNSNRLIRRI